MKGIILAGGSGTRLKPITNCISKQLLPIYNKPMIYYPLSTLMLAGISEILILTNVKDSGTFQELLGDGSQLGLNIKYEKQLEPKGISQAFIIAEDFIGQDNVCLVLGDNIFYGNKLSKILESATSQIEESGGGIVFGYYVQNPGDYGVIEHSSDFLVKSIEEKPDNPKSNCAATGLYMYDNTVVEIAKRLKPSHRGELEITDLNKIYLSRRKLRMKYLSRGHAWFDTGTHEMFFEASNFVRSIETRQGLMISNIEEIAFRTGYIDSNQLRRLINSMSDNEYKDYLINRVLDEA